VTPTKITLTEVASVTSISQIYHVVINCSNLKRMNLWVVYNGITSIASFIKIHPSVLEFKYADRHRHISPVCFHSVHIVQRKHSTDNGDAGNAIKSR
jgi:hypothetical protein